MVTTRHLCYRVSEGGPQRTDWNKTFMIIISLKQYSEHQPRANLVSLGSLMLYWYQAVLVLVWGWHVRAMWTVWRPDENWDPHTPHSPPLSRPPTSLRVRQIPDRTHTAWLTCISVWGPEKHNYPPDLFWLLSCSQKYQINIWCFEGVQEIVPSCQLLLDVQIKNLPLE